MLPPAVVSISVWVYGRYPNGGLCGDEADVVLMPKPVAFV